MENKGYISPNKTENLYVKSVLLYGCETWKASSKYVKQIQVFINMCLPKLHKIRWVDKGRNEEVWRRIEQLLIVEEIGKCWKWIGHTLKKSDKSITNRSCTGIFKAKNQREDNVVKSRRPGQV